MHKHIYMCAYIHYSHIHMYVHTLNNELLYIYIYWQKRTIRLDALRCRLTRGLCSLGPGCSACPCWRSTRCRRCTCCLRRPSALNSLDLGKQIFIILAKQVVERENGNSRDTNLAWQCQYGKISKSCLGMTERRNLPQVCTNVRKAGRQGYIALI